MKILIVKSSYRKGSNSSILADRVLEGAKAAGADVEVIDIGRLVISNCRGCYGCLAPNADFCVVKDAMHPFYKSIFEADAIVFASPVYWFSICGQAKQFIDRMFAVAVLPSKPFSKKKLAAVFSFEDTDEITSGCINAIKTFENICGLTEAQWIGSVYGSMNELNEADNKPELQEAAYNLGKAVVEA